MDSTFNFQIMRVRKLWKETKNGWKILKILKMVSSFIYKTINWDDLKFDWKPDKSFFLVVK